MKNDRDSAALALCRQLGRCRTEAFSIVRVPSEDEERDRAFTRQRQQIVRERQRLQAMERSLLASHGIRYRQGVGGQEDVEDLSAEKLSREWVIEQPEGAHPIDRTEGGRGEGDDRGHPGSWHGRHQIPEVSAPDLRRCCAGSRRRRAANAQAGLELPGSAQGSTAAAVTARRRCQQEEGNPRVQAMLVENGPQRTMRWQWLHRLKRWMLVLGDPGRDPAVRKAIVAIARQLAVDLWRLFTGQTTADKLGLIISLIRPTKNRILT